MRSIRVHGPGAFSLDDIDPPEPGELDALVRVEACGICGSDLAYIDRGMTGFGVAGFTQPRNGPCALGHEAAGTVLALGDGVPDLAVGDLVAINPIDPTFGAAIGNGGPEGALSEVLLVRNAADPGRLLKVPAGVPPEIAALAEPMGVALHSVHRSQVDADTKVVVLGAGPIGLGALIWLKHKGVGHVVVVDLSADRLARAAGFGADATIQAGTGDLAEQLVALHGTGLRGAPGTDVFLDAAGSPAALDEVVRIARRGSRVTVVAVYKAPVSVDLSAMLHREMSLVTSLAYPTELPEVVAFLAANAERMRGFITDTYPITEFDQAVARARETTGAKVMVRVAS